MVIHIHIYIYTYVFLGPGPGANPSVLDESVMAGIGVRPGPGPGPGPGPVDWDNGKVDKTMFKIESLFFRKKTTPIKYEWFGNGSQYIYKSNLYIYIPMYTVCIYNNYIYIHIYIYI